jgi:hypothetical protein
MGLRCRAAGRRMGGVCRAFLLAARTDGPDASYRWFLGRGRVTGVTAMRSRSVLRRTVT